MRIGAWLRMAAAGAATVAILALLAFTVLPEGATGGRFWLFAVLSGVLVGMILPLFSDGQAARSREGVDRVLKELSAGNLDVSADPASLQAMEDFPGLRRVLRSFQNIIGYLQDGTESVSSASTGISTKTRALFREIEDQVDSVDKARGSIRQLEGGIEKVVQSVDTLSSFSEETGSAVLELRASIDEVVTSTHNLSAFADEIGSSIEEMARSVEEVAEHTESLSSFAIENSSAMVEMDATIGQIEENIQETEALSQQVSQVAAAGTKVVKDTVRGLEKIHKGMGANVDAMNALDLRSKEIGKILKVIREIADQTNLLALNAAIIAAQAGEHGRSFAVVAEEIRDLSERTAASTSEVGAITATIQGEVDGAVRVANDVMERVKEGLDLGRASEENLQRISQVIDLAGTSISHIARAASEQSKGSKQVTAAIEEMTKRIERISTATREQAKTSQLINQKSLTMKELTRNVDRAMEEQSTGSNGIAQGMDKVRGSIESIQKALVGMSQVGQRMVTSMDTISGASQQNLAGARDLAATASVLSQESLLLSEQLGTFSMPKPAYGGEVRIGYVSYQFNLDPAFADNIRDGELAHPFNSGLLRFGYGTRLLPGVSDSWEVSPDGRAYTFHVRASAMFHNGRAITAEDVSFSWHRALAPRLEKEGQWFLSAVEGAEEYMAGKASRIEGLKVLDERTIEVRLKEPLAFFLYMLTTPEASVIPKEAVDEKSLKILRPLGCGPYVVTDHGRDRVVMERFRGFYDANLAYADRLVYDYSAPSEEKILAKLRTGELHTALSLSNEALEGLLSDPAWENQTETTVLLNTQILSLRNDLAPASVKEFRQALNFAVDREGLLARFPHMRVTPAKGILPPGILGYRSDRKGFYFDPEKARWLMGRAGLGAGVDLKVPLDQSRASQFQEFMALAEMFRAVGVRVETEPVSHEEFEVRRRRSGGRPIFYSTGWYADYPDPDNFLFVVFHKAGGDPLQFRYSNPKLDDLVERARRSMDVDERVKLYQEAEDIVVEDAPGVFLYHAWGMVPHSPDLMGMKLSLTPPLMRPERLWLKGQSQTRA